jgi:hypothetical protein
MTDWTTLLAPLRAWWRGAPPPPERQAAVPEKPARRPSVPAEYLSLFTYLDDRYASTVVLTFDQMETLLGFALPEPAGRDRDWWTAGSARNHAAAWIGARRSAMPNLVARTVTFERLTDRT